MPFANGKIGGEVSRKTSKPYFDRNVLSWALYDWANSAFATTVMAGFFPIAFKKLYSGELATTESTYYLGLSNSMAGLFLAIMAPILGAIADSGGWRKPFLAGFACLGIGSTAALYFIGSGQWTAAMWAYVLGSVGFAGANIFYDALLVEVSPREEMDFVSGYGFSLGYLGGGILFAINVLMTLKPEFFGLADATQALGVSFLSVSVWWTLFSVPLFLNVHERPRERQKASLVHHVRQGLRQLAVTFGKIRQLKPLLVFLAAYLFYIEGVNTIIKMAVDYGMALGFPTDSLIVALLMVQFIGFPAALIFGYLGLKIGTKPALFLGLGIYAGVTVWGYFLENVTQFYIMAALIGLVQGGVQALSRSLYGRMIPRDQAAEYFGFFNMLGKFSSVIGPFFVGWVALASGSSRLSILSVLAFFVVGASLLKAVKTDYQAPS